MDILFMCSSLDCYFSRCITVLGQKPLLVQLHVNSYVLRTFIFKLFCVSVIKHCNVSTMLKSMYENKSVPFVWTWKIVLGPKERI